MLPDGEVLQRVFGNTRLSLLAFSGMGLTRSSALYRYDMEMISDPSTGEITIVDAA